MCAVGLHNLPGRRGLQIWGDWAGWECNVPSAAAQPGLLEEPLQATAWDYASFPSRNSSSDPQMTHLISQPKIPSCSAHGSRRKRRGGGQPGGLGAAPKGCSQCPRDARGDDPCQECGKRSQRRE